MKTARENWIESQCRDIEDEIALGDNKKAYQLLKTLTKISRRPQLSKTATTTFSQKAIMLYSSDGLSTARTSNFQLKTDFSILQNNQAADEPADLPVLYGKRSKEEGDCLLHIQDSGSPVKKSTVTTKTNLQIISDICKFLANDKCWTPEDRAFFNQVYKDEVIRNVQFLDDCLMLLVLQGRRHGVTIMLPT